MHTSCLVVRGGWEGHDPLGTTDAFIPWLERRGFVVDVEDSPEIYADARAMAGYDLVVQCVTQGHASPEAIDGLRSAVEAGTGFAGWHGGVLSSFGDAKGYLQLMGAHFVAHPHDARDRGRAGVPAFRDYTVELTAAGLSHPITRGLEPFEVRTEQYWMLDDGLNEVLATCEMTPQAGDPWRRTVTMPVAWTREWGAGRIFATTLGHQLEDVEMPAVRSMIERGMDWAAKQR